MRIYSLMTVRNCQMFPCQDPFKVLVRRQNDARDTLSKQKRREPEQRRNLVLQKKKKLKFEVRKQVSGLKKKNEVGCTITTLIIILIMLKRLNQNYETTPCLRLLHTKEIKFNYLYIVTKQCSCCAEKPNYKGLILS